MSPQPGPDVVVDIAAAAEVAARPASDRADFLWNLEGDVLRDLLMPTAG